MVFSKQHYKGDYYYQLKSVRQACLDSTDERTTPSTAAAIIRGANGLTIELLENASTEFMRKLIGVCAYAQ